MAVGSAVRMADSLDDYSVAAKDDMRVDLKVDLKVS